MDALRLVGFVIVWSVPTKYADALDQGGRSEASFETIVVLGKHDVFTTCCAGVEGGDKSI